MTRRAELHAKATDGLSLAAVGLVAGIPLTVAAALLSLWLLPLAAVALAVTLVGFARWGDAKREITREGL